MLTTVTLTQIHIDPGALPSPKKDPCLPLCLFPKLALAGGRNPEETEDLPRVKQCDVSSHFCKCSEQFFSLHTKTHTRCRIIRSTNKREKKKKPHHLNNPRKLPKWHLSKPLGACPLISLAAFTSVQFLSYPQHKPQRQPHSRHSINIYRSTERKKEREREVITS